MNNLQTQDWYNALVDDCKAIITERLYRSRQEIIECWHEVGERITTDVYYQKYAKGNVERQRKLAEDIGKSLQSLYFAIQFYSKFPVLSNALETFKEGKNISWFKIVNKYLPELPKDETPLTEEQIAKFQKQVIQGDCIEEMKKLPDKSIDMIYVDPPYGVGKDEWDTFEEGEFLPFTASWIKECIRLLKPQSHLFIHFPSQKAAWLEDLMLTEFSMMPASRIIWCYRNLIQGRDATTHFLSTYQPILHYNFGNKELNFPTEWNDERFDVWNIASPQTNFNEGKTHVSQKPLELMDRLVRFGSFEGELVLDPMAGSGTTGVACIKNDRDFILIERESKYVDIIHKRLNDISE